MVSDHDVSIIKPFKMATHCYLLISNLCHAHQTSLLGTPIQLSRSSYLMHLHSQGGLLRFIAQYVISATSLH